MNCHEFIVEFLSPSTFRNASCKDSQRSHIRKTTRPFISCPENRSGGILCPYYNAYRKQDLLWFLTCRSGHIIVNDPFFGFPILLLKTTHILDFYKKLILLILFFTVWKILRSLPKKGIIYSLKTIIYVVVVRLIKRV